MLAVPRCVWFFSSHFYEFTTTIVVSLSILTTLCACSIFSPPRSCLLLAKMGPGKGHGPLNTKRAPRLKKGSNTQKSAFVAICVCARARTHNVSCNSAFTHSWKLWQQSYHTRSDNSVLVTDFALNLPVDTNLPPI